MIPISDRGLDRLLVAIEVSGDYSDLVKEQERLITALLAEVTASRAFIRPMVMVMPVAAQLEKLFYAWITASADAVLAQAKFEASQ